MILLESLSKLLAGKGIFDHDHFVLTDVVSKNGLRGHAARGPTEPDSGKQEETDMCDRTARHETYPLLGYNKVEVTIDGHGSYKTCAEHLSDAMVLYKDKTVNELQNAVLWISEGDHTSVDEIVQIRAIKDRFHLLVMIASMSASEPTPDYTISERYIPTDEEVMRYIGRIIEYQADRLS